MRKVQFNYTPCYNKKEQFCSTLMKGGGEMKIYCAATLENKMQFDNLCQCIEILGGEPNTSFNDVMLEYEGDRETCESFIELFEHYPHHGIFTET